MVSRHEPLTYNRVVRAPRAPIISAMLHELARAAAISNATTLFTGDKEIPWETGYDMDGYVYWEEDQPLPATVVSVMGQLVTQDK